jgi:hypothetical protein
MKLAGVVSVAVILGCPGASDAQAAVTEDLLLGAWTCETASGETRMTSSVVYLPAANRHSTCG